MSKGCGVERLSTYFDGLDWHICYGPVYYSLFLRLHVAYTNCRFHRQIFLTGLISKCVCPWYTLFFLLNPSFLRISSKPFKFVYDEDSKPFLILCPTALSRKLQLCSYPTGMTQQLHLGSPSKTIALKPSKVVSMAIVKTVRQLQLLFEIPIPSLRCTLFFLSASFL